MSDPEPIVSADVARDAAAELADMAAGIPPRRWRCPMCGATHDRGHFVIGGHRCLDCRYVGAGGDLLD